MPRQTRNGGIPFPDLIKYSNASHIAMISRLLPLNNKNEWTKIYSEYTHPHELQESI